MSLYAFPWILCILLLFLTIYIKKDFLRKQERMQMLQEAIDAFLQENKPLEISLLDDEWAPLQNAVVDLQEQVLLERKKRQEEEAKNGRFISDISHQLKTPIAGLRLFLQMDQMRQASSHNQQELELVDKMEQLVQELLQLEKIKVDTYLMTFAPASLADLAKYQAGQIQSLFPHCQIQVRGEARLRVDQKWLGEALGNLLKNACEHSKEGGLVSLLIEDNPNSVFLRIQDQGGGVKEEQLPNLFTRFFKTENAAKNSTGIGMAIAKAIIERHHGIITAENKEDGLCITICLPRIDGQEALD